LARSLEESSDRETSRNSLRPLGLRPYNLEYRGEMNFFGAVRAPVVTRIRRIARQGPRPWLQVRITNTPANPGLTPVVCWSRPRRAPGRCQCDEWSVTAITSGYRSRSGAAAGGARWSPKARSTTSVESRPTPSRRSRHMTARSSSSDASNIPWSSQRLARWAAPRAAPRACDSGLRPAGVAPWRSPDESEKPLGRGDAA
jgi:hypothetical protein